MVVLRSARPCEGVALWGLREASFCKLASLKPYACRQNQGGHRDPRSPRMDRERAHKEPEAQMEPNGGQNVGTFWPRWDATLHRCPIGAGLG